MATSSCSLGRQFIKLQEALSDECLVGLHDDGNIGAMQLNVSDHWLRPAKGYVVVDVWSSSGPESEEREMTGVMYVELSSLSPGVIERSGVCDW
jgi:hypothetical protein